MDILKIEQLYKLKEEKKAMVVDSCAEGTVHLWEVINGQNIEEYVALSDNTVITRKEDNEQGANMAFFPYPTSKAKQIPFDQAIEMVKEY
jgi:hypothetical protein